ncbi:hypothetical protein [sulfur-oxidizing endosymbiont of Gigantopelta aegis]|uniref:hypothetical protein n=1 Tax=sulfur-oxidizing endosymbiont of Gigantopelta aegis TaxID=2794934 RepID=UPI0018DB47F9|nr:hypothetical protein [sulfur-oxidizing endosymbiont of Gigantopelta aegis]
MMTIAVSLFRKDDKFYTQLLYGRPTKIVNSDNGKIALVSENELFLYETVVRKTNVYLFRGVGDISIPFVSPGVNLISHGNNIMQKNKLIKTLKWLEDHGYDPNQFDDDFWLRVQAIINSKSYGKKHLLSLLEKETS